MRLTSATLALGLLAAAAPALAAPTYAVEKTIALPDGGWDLVSHDPAMGRVYVARTDAVTAIETGTGTVTGKLAGATRGHAAIPLNSGAEVLITNGGTNTADIIDAKTGKVLAAIHTGAKPDAAIYDAPSGLAVVMNAQSGDITLIDPKTRKAVGTIPVGGSLELAASLGGGVIALNVEDKNEAVLVDLKAKKVTAHIALTGCDGPTGIAWLPRAGRILSTCANGVAALSDPKTGQATGTLPIGKGPDTALYDPARHIALVPAGRSSELDIFSDEASGVVAAGKLDTHLGARTGAIDEATGKVYLVAADYLPADKPGGRPAAKPGSVVLMVIAPK